MNRTAIRDVALLFLRLGATAFGGPAAHVALLEDEVVRKRGWVTRQEFLDLYSVSNIIPGPNSTELAIHLGYRRAGWTGLIVAGVCFIAPAMLIVWLLAIAYVRLGARVEVSAMLVMMQPVIVAVVFQAIWRLGRVALHGMLAWTIAIGSVTALVFGTHELVVLAAAATIALGWSAIERGRASVVTPVAGMGASQVLPDSASLAAAAVGGAVASITSSSIFLTFAKIGTVLFGSGYVLLAFLRREFVERQLLLTDAQLLDAITIGQVTPGPVFTTATFVGYLLAGNSGAMAATIGIFLPAFIFVALTARVVHSLRTWWAGSALLVGLNAASLALMATVVVLLAGSVTRSPWTIAIFLVSLALLLAGRAGTGVLLAGAAGLGLVTQLFRG